MSKAVVLDDRFLPAGEFVLPDYFSNVCEHNLYLYVRSYLASVRANGAQAKTRGMVSGGGKKPWAQKGSGRARAGSITSPIFVGGGVSHGPSNNRNYSFKINKKQKKLALEFAIKQKADSGSLFIVDSIKIESGKTKDAYAKFSALKQPSTLLVAQMSDEKTCLSFRNLRQCYLVDAGELNAYLVAAFRSVVIEKSVLDELLRGN